MEGGSLPLNPFFLPPFCSPCHPPAFSSIAAFLHKTDRRHFAVRGAGLPRVLLPRGDAPVASIPNVKRDISTDASHHITQTATVTVLLVVPVPGHNVCSSQDILV